MALPPESGVSPVVRLLLLRQCLLYLRFTPPPRRNYARFIHCNLNVLKHWALAVLQTRSKTVRPYLQLRCESIFSVQIFLNIYLPLVFQHSRNSTSPKRGKLSHIQVVAMLFCSTSPLYLLSSQRIIHSVLYFYKTEKKGYTSSHSIILSVMPVLRDSD